MLAAGIAYGINHYLTDRFIDIPDQRGIKDDVLEAVLKGPRPPPRPSWPRYSWALPIFR